MEIKNKEAIIIIGAVSLLLIAIVAGIATGFLSDFKKGYNEVGKTKVEENKKDKSKLQRK